jgi:N-acetylglucosaminyldiphosphoundecaprenol N-acetyl-beta-D-mannosaminyltransferase
MSSALQASATRVATPMAELLPPAEIFGVPLHRETMGQTVERIARLIDAGGAHQHVVLNAAKVVQMADDASLRDIVAGCAVINADGQSVVWAARLLGVDIPERVTGVDLMQHLLDKAAERGWAVYFLGAEEQIVRDVARIEQERHPGLVVAGWRNGFWTPEQEADVVADVAATRATLLFAAMPTPRKERFLAEHLDDLGVTFAMGVGGSFDIVAGVTRRAPVWMQRAGLEWSYRLLQEPRRMFKRYLVGNTRFILLTMREMRAARRKKRR